MNDDKIRYLSNQWVSNLHGKEFNSTSEEMLFQSYAYQDGYKAGADLMQEKMIEKAVEWLDNNVDKYCFNSGGKFEYIPKVGRKMISDFKQAMEEL